MQTNPIIITPQSEEKLKLRVKLTHTHLDGEELRNIECRIADLLTERFEESAASPSVLQISGLIGLSDDRQVMTYRSERWPLRITVSGVSLLSTGENAEAFLEPISKAIITLFSEKAIAPVNTSTDVCVCAVGGTGCVIPGAGYLIPNLMGGAPFPRQLAIRDSFCCSRTQRLRPSRHRCRRSNYATTQ